MDCCTGGCREKKWHASALTSSFVTLADTSHYSKLTSHQMEANTTADDTRFLSLSLNMSVSLSAQQPFPTVANSHSSQQCTVIDCQTRKYGRTKLRNGGLGMYA